jgi:hypothetical protein
MIEKVQEPQEGELWSINRRTYIGRIWFDPGEPILVLGCWRPKTLPGVLLGDGVDRVRILRAIIGGQQYEMYVHLDLFDRLDG